MCLRLEKEKQLVKSEVDEARLQTEHANKAKVNICVGICDLHVFLELFFLLSSLYFPLTNSYLYSGECRKSGQTIGASTARVEH